MTFSAGEYGVDVATISAPAHLLLNNHTFAPADLNVTGNVTVEAGGNVEATLARVTDGTSSVRAGGRFAAEELLTNSPIERPMQD